ncbi:centromere protein R isoform X2 [Marmota monax]|uniref:centromere protein R isoform X2 n=1 Tax=Marmota monax TaxID=9995 RepID=UPI0026ED4F30|nr:centromere protein R isoform X2 [Marmota monax]
MPVKRSLKLDDQLEENSFDPSKITKKRSITAYSPTTGTCQMSPFSSPTSSKEQEPGNGPSNGGHNIFNLHLCGAEDRTQCLVHARFMVLLSKVETSSEEIMEIMKNLNNIKALEGNRELENLISISRSSCFLKREVEKTKELVTKLRKQKLCEKNSVLPHKELCHLDSYEFLKAVLKRGEETEAQRS